MYLWVTGWLTTTGTQELRKLYYISTYNTMKPKYFRFLKFLHHSSFNKYIQLNKYGKKDTFCQKTPARTKQLKPWELVTTTMRQSLVAICSILLQPRLDTNYCLWTVMSEQNLQSCLKLRNAQNPFFHILETLNKNYEKKNGMICSFSSDL